ncbi:MAG: winged helix-turn-helix domain-containing protein [Candidatus Bathycorpusculaceae bacterium]
MQLVQDGKILFEMPLLRKDWPVEELENEFKAVEEDFQLFSKIFDALSHETRLRMMRRLIAQEDRTMSFADFMHDLDLNPKIVWENSKKLTEGGLLKKTSRGKYSCSQFGQTTFMMVSLALHRLIESLGEMEILEEVKNSDI